MSASATPITATVPNKLVGDHRSDLLLVGLLKAAGIPAVSIAPGWMFKVNTSVDGVLTRATGKETTVFTWVPTPVPPTAEETQIANLTAELADANAHIASLKEDIADTDSDNALLTKQLATANAQIATLQAQIASAESNLKAATINAGGATGPTAPASTPAA